MNRKPILRLFAERFGLAAVLVFLTYNTFSDFSYYHWAFETPFEGFGELAGAAKIVVGLILAILYLILFHGAYRAKGIVGIFLTVIVVAAVVYLLQVGGIIDLRNGSTGIITSQIIVVLVLALGSIWAIWWRRFTGQVHTEDPDTGDE